VLNDPSNFLRNLVNLLVPPPEFFRPSDPSSTPPLPNSSASPQSGARRSKRGTEAVYRDQLALSLGGVTEVVTPSGRIDIVTATEIIEVKAAARWKHALGQILSYGRYYPLHQKRIHLYGEIDPRLLEQVREQCACYGVNVTWQA
jgi:hypothetical protein